MDELQEAWNAEGVEGSREEIRQFWEGMLERRERGEVSAQRETDAGTQTDAKYYCGSIAGPVT